MDQPLIAAVDDEYMNIELIGFIIKSMNYRFLGLTKSQEALSLFHSEPPDLILLDVQMPQLDGFELCEKLKADTQLKDIPVIFLTGLNQSENKIKGLELGGVDYVTKPFNKYELTARIKTHINLVRANHKIQRQSRKLKEDLVMKNRLFSIIGHDLRSPLSSIKMQLDLILRGIIDPSEKDFIKTNVHQLTNTTDEAFNLLDNLLNWAKSESGVLSIVKERVNIKETVEQIERLQGLSLKEKQIAFKTEVPDNAFVTTDLNMLKTILRNLISNAVKFTPKKGVILIEAVLEKGSWYISVQDNGTGMSTEELSKVLDTKEHFSKEGTEHEAGTGLGLILCQDFIQKNDGQLTVESTPGKGSRFTFTMPSAD